MKVAELKTALARVQEPKGYYFSHDVEMVDSVLEQLLTNKERYGYMACPCRLANGDKEKDRDILCPCVYREPDVAEFGACFCGLYVSAEFNAQKCETPVVPDRRSPDKIF